MNTIRAHPLLFAVAVFLLGNLNGIGGTLLAQYAQGVSNAPQLTAVTATPTPRQDPKTAYYIGVYDACLFFAVNAGGMAAQQASDECLGFVYQVSQASWYEASGK